MAIQDADPERRNLMVASIAFIIFYYAEGKITAPEVRLQVVNVYFDSPIVLAVFAWVMIFWFALRYWQTHQYEYKRAERSDIEKQTINRFVIWYVSQETGLKYREIGGFSPNKICRDRKGWVIEYSIWLEGKENEYGEIAIIGKQEQKTTDPIKGFAGFFLKLYIRAAAMIKMQGFTSYGVPYILFLLAITSPLVKYVILF